MNQPGGARRVGASDDILTQVAPGHLTIGMVLVCCLVILASTLLLYRTGDLPPPTAPPPVKPKNSGAEPARGTIGYFMGQVAQDARKAGLKDFDPQRVKQPSVYFTEFSGDMPLKNGGKMETTHLELTAVVEKVWVGQEGSGLRTDHINLAIRNKTDKHLAYQVRTEVWGKCGNKGVLSHNALALKPYEEVKRSECLPKEKGVMRIKSVEVLEISPIGYYYVSRLEPRTVGISSRTSEGHQEGTFGTCKIIPWRTIEAALRKGAKWFDVLDFYSRHNCDEYSFPGGYRFSPSGPATLPAVSP